MNLSKLIIFRKLERISLKCVPKIVHITIFKLLTVVSKNISPKSKRNFFFYIDIKNIFAVDNKINNKNEFE